MRIARDRYLEKIVRKKHNGSVKVVTGARGTAVSVDTVSSYFGHLTESFPFDEAKRYDVKGKRYFDHPSKYYCVDVGLRNARLNLRQQEETHIMENIVYNELPYRGYAVDVGVVEISEKDAQGKRRRKNREIDFVANKGPERIYIQSALSMDDDAKAAQELRPLLGAKDFFRKVVVSKTLARPWTDDRGVLHIGIYDFLTDENAIWLLPADPPAPCREALLLGLAGFRERSDGARITGSITNESIEALGLAEGGKAVAIVKATDVMVAVD